MSGQVVRIPPCSAKAVELAPGDELVVIDPEGEQVSDLVAFNREDMAEYLSSGRSIDYASRLFLTTGDVLYSNRSRPMFTLLEDTCGRHDFTLTPCSKEMFEKLYGLGRARRDAHHLPAHAASSGPVARNGQRQPAPTARPLYWRASLAWP